MNTNIRELQKEEALKRMRKLKLHQNVIDEFNQKNELNCSVLRGALFPMPVKFKNIVKEFETQQNVLVYHTIFTPTSFGELLSILYISDNIEEWEIDNKDLEFNAPLVYVKNLDDDFCSEFGSILIESKNGGLIRIA